MTAKFYIISLFVTLFVTPNLSLGKEILIKNKSTSYNITANLEYVLIEKNHIVNNNLIKSIDWQNFNNNALLFGNKKEVYLLKCQLKNTSNESRFVVSLEQPNIDHFEIFDSSFQSIGLTGDIYDWSTREYKESYPSFSLQLQKNSAQTFYFLVFMAEDGVAPLKLYTQIAYHKFFAQREWIFGIFLGLMGVIALYNLFLYFVVKDIIYLSYSIYVISILLAQGSMYGNFLGHIYGSSILLSKIDMILFTSILSPLGWFFTLTYFNFLNKKYIFPIVIALVIPFILTIVAILLDNNLVDFSMQLLNIAYLPTYLFIYLIAILGLRIQKELASIFLVAWTLLLLGGTTYILTNWGIIDYSPKLTYLMPIGAALETIILSLALGYRIRILKREKNITSELLETETQNSKQLQSHLKDVELQAIRGQINPHFIFNALNSIQFLIHKPDNEKASKYLSIFSRLIRKSLQFTEMKRISIHDEIDFIKDYVKIEQLRFQDPFMFTIEIGDSPSLRDASVPPLITQPFIENAIKHAFTTDTKNGQLIMRINLDEKEELILVEIQDNGQGIQEKTEFQYASKGISISEKRLALLNSDIKANLLSLTISNIPSSNQSTDGVLVKFSLPLH